MGNQLSSELLASGSWVIYAGYACVALATFIVVRMVMQEEESRAAQENLAERANDPNASKLVRLMRPFFTQYVVPVVRGKKFWDGQRKKFRRKLISSGLKETFTPDEFISFKFVLIVFFPIVGAVLKAGDFIDVPPTYILLSGVAGWFYPDLWVNSRIAKRRKQIIRAMPFIVDLLALSTEAGLDFIGAIGKVVEKATPSPLVEEFSQLLKEIKVGSSRAEALREMGLRIDMTEINSFIAILISADQMGAPIGRVLRQQSDAIRTQRMLAAEKAGAAASQKILFPLIFIIMPAVMLMIFGPFGLSMMSGGGLN